MTNPAEYFNENKNIGPSVADFRTFLMNCSPRPQFDHIILACGTAIRGDLLDNVSADQISPDFQEVCEEMKKHEGILSRLSAEKIEKLYAVLTLNNIKDPAEIIAIPTGQKTWLVHMPNYPLGRSIMNLSPAETCDDACIYGLSAYRADMTRPTIVAIMIYSGTYYDIYWPYGRPDTYYWQ